MPRLEELSSPRTKAKLSKWSKVGPRSIEVLSIPQVKEAFKWERSPSEPPLSGMVQGMGEEQYSEIKQKFQIITSSSSSEELPSDIYNFDDHPLEICLQRRSSFLPIFHITNLLQPYDLLPSSSVSECFASTTSFRGLEAEQRRHRWRTLPRLHLTLPQPDEPGGQGGGAPCGGGRQEDQQKYLVQGQEHAGSQTGLHEEEAKQEELLL